MKSPLLALLLIVNMLACPVRCFPTVANAAVAEECAPAICSCCPQASDTPASDTPESDTPQPCGDDCNCQNCICDGAVVESSVGIPETVSYVSWEQAKFFAKATFGGHFDIFTRRSLAPDGQLLGGRDRCVTHQAWLI